VLSDTGLLAGIKGMEVGGYEIHMGQSKSSGETGAFQVIETPQGKTDYADGALDERGMILGTYMHGLFYNDDFRQAFLNNLRRRWGLEENKNSISADKDRQYDKLADLVRQNIDLDKVYRIMEAGV
jgi:adenosylcobyric acid synthase